jgi:hypothetical protein
MPGSSKRSQVVRSERQRGRGSDARLAARAGAVRLSSFGEMRVAPPFELGSCFDVGAVFPPGADHAPGSFQGRCVAMLRGARRQTWCLPKPEV